MSDIKKTEQNLTSYYPSDGVRVKVSNKPVYEDDVLTHYERNVTIFIKAGDSKDKLDFKEVDSIAKWIETVDFEDPQQTLDV